MSSPNNTTANNQQVKSDIPAGLWLNCKSCSELLYQSSLEENLQVCPSCGFHFSLTAAQRIKMLVDPDSFQEIDPSLHSCDPLNFSGDGSYAEKLLSSKQKTNLQEAVVCGSATLNRIPYALAAMDFRFMGASMGSAVGEKITRMLEMAVQRSLPALIVTASGGARMQEGILSLMQMAKTSAAVMRHDEAGLPLIIILTNPTTGGVTASFASLGDIILAEPKALIGFAGPRVIKQTTQADLPEGFQSAEFLLEHGFIDRIVERKKLRRELGLLLHYLGGGRAI
ncbi:MAG: acetyl-CoA carboxylase carboxyltransferase subunit beta [Oligosphaeraceae bacterium]|nr:acetyl-CoA carboxylase carboxyltransferase subunit beta [Oligosphaeraceae bacterium]